jgi:hypothetical protein
VVLLFQCEQTRMVREMCYLTPYVASSTFYTLQNHLIAGRVYQILRCTTYVRNACHVAVVRVHTLQLYPYSVGEASNVRCMQRRAQVLSLLFTPRFLRGRYGMVPLTAFALFGRPGDIIRGISTYVASVPGLKWARFDAWTEFLM